jgi:hypothetical protein
MLRWLAYGLAYGPAQGMPAAPDHVAQLTTSSIALRMIGSP